MVLVVKNLPAKAGDIRDRDSIPASGTSPGRGRDILILYSYLENPLDRGAWRARVHGATKSQTWLSDSAHERMREETEETWIREEGS